MWQSICRKLLLLLTTFSMFYLKTGKCYSLFSAVIYFSVELERENVTNGNILHASYDSTRSTPLYVHFLISLHRYTITSMSSFTARRYITINKIDFKLNLRYSIC